MAKLTKSVADEITLTLDVFASRYASVCEELGMVAISKKLKSGGRLTIRYTDPAELRRRRNP